MGIDLALNYNSRLWNKDSSTMTFNYNKGWPAAGWSIGYGRIVKNYNNTASGDGSGVGFNPPGDFLLVQPDGSRVHLAQSYDASTNSYVHDSTDGTFLHLSDNNKLSDTNGTVVQYSNTNNRLLPTSIRTRNGSVITIAYKLKTSSFKYRWAIDYITDTLGRVVQFKYYGVDSGYPADAANGKPQNALAAVTAPDFSSGTRTLVRLEYQDMVLSYNFGSMTVNGPTTSTLLTVVKRIYYPATGRGYLFLDYSTYGMARRISTRKDMTGAGGTITDGTEIAYTKYYYTTIDPFDPYNRHQVGALNDSPQYTKREEWWQNKTDSSGNPDNAPAVYTYSRSTGTNTEIDTVKYPNNLDMVTTTNDNPGSNFKGTVTSIEYKNGSSVLRKTNYFYTLGPDGGVQIAAIDSYDETTQRVRTEYDYGNFGRVTNMYEYGLGTTVLRRTKYDYSSDPNHLSAKLMRLVTQVTVFDVAGNRAAKTIYSYDDYAAKGGMETYGLTSSTFPPGHNNNFDQTKIYRGNVTGVQTYKDAEGGITVPTKYTKYDIFGNAIEADVSCCMMKAFNFSSTNYYSQPDSERQGSTGGPNLTLSFQYDFNTGLGKQTTDSDGLITTVQYDSAWRVSRVNSPSGAFTTTSFDKDANGNDQLSYGEQANYIENGISKQTTNRSWFDGVGRLIRGGSGAGASPANYDTVKIVYDNMGGPLDSRIPM